MLVSVQVDSSDSKKNFFFLQKGYVLKHIFNLMKGKMSCELGYRGKKEFSSLHSPIPFNKRWTKGGQTPPAKFTLHHCDRAIRPWPPDL